MYNNRNYELLFCVTIQRYNIEVLGVVVAQFGILNICIMGREGLGFCGAVHSASEINFSLVYIVF